MANLHHHNHQAPARPKLVAVIGGRQRRPGTAPRPVPAAASGRVRTSAATAASGTRR
jgi:hypothetical protein